MRLRRAGQLLRQQAGSVSETAFRVGFADANDLSREYKRVMRMTRTELVTGSTSDVEREAGR